MKYRIAVHKSKEDYSVSVPGLPGCWSRSKWPSRPCTHERARRSRNASRPNAQFRTIPNPGRALTGQCA